MENKELKLDLGCGRNKREGYVGVDADSGVGADIVASALDLPFEDESVDEVHSSHLVEHFDPSDAQKFFDEVFRVLKKGKTAYIKVDRDWTSKRLLRKNPEHKYRYTEDEIRAMVRKFSKAEVKNRIYFINFYTPRNKIFVHLEK